ncbi:MAG: alginate lyase family protein, partial [Ruminococcus sp.]|nr:alginate lyase family protein [Candidatus Apopatosoma intestinale]
MVRKDYTYANSADTIRRMIDENEESRKTWEETKAIARTALSRFHDDITKESGWGHSFVCPACTERLTFVMKDRCEPPKEYPCPHCGKIATGREIENAWVAAYRNTLSHYASRCVPGILLGDEECRTSYLRYMNYYADHYEDFAPHGRWVGKGKVFAQSLDEAIWALLMARELYACRNAIPAETRADWYRRWFRPMAEFLYPQANRIHNISLWVLSAVGAIAICFDDSELLDRALNGEYGIRRQIAEGFTEDGLWRECSVHYHYYALHALTYFLGIYAAVCPDDPLFDLLGKFYTVPLLFSHDGVQLQAINDGWYPLTTDEKFWQISYAARIVSEP